MAGGAALTGAAVTAGGADAATKKRPRPPRVGSAKRPQRVDVAIVGAGLAGLTAATELRRRGAAVHVIEADVRVGGRIWTGRAKDGTPLNYGATFIGPGQDRIAALARRLGVETYDTYNAGSNVLVFGGRRDVYTGTIPPVDPAALVEGAVAIERLNAMAGELDPAAPWAAARADEYDGQTMETWKLANVQTAGARKLLDLAVNALFSVESRDISLLYVLFYIRSAGSLSALVDTAGGAQEKQFTGGSQQIPDRLAAALGRSRVTLRSPVRRIATTGDRTVVTSDRISLRAKRVIVAVPPPLAARIEFLPGLAARKDQLWQRLPMGSIGKAIAVYDRPFWRAKGLSGQSTSDEGPINATFDISPASGSPGVLMGFIDGQDAREHSRRSAAERRARSLAQLATFFGEEARSPREYQDVLWDELPLHRGCPVAVPGPGALTGYPGVLHEEDGAIRFAGTELATTWAGYMDGAIQSGLETAQAVAEELGR